MGGTSTDVAVVLGGRPQWSTAGVVDGLPIGLPAFDIHTVGAGGGSVAAIDAGGALRVGPRSAGAVPGPACYGRGGHDATVTDADVVLGRILGDRFLGGGMTIEIDRAVRAVQPLAERMGRSLTDAALGIVRVAEANMAAAAAAVTSQRGHDPRRFALVSFGGAGGLHACNVAAALDVRRVVVPPYSGVLSALGMVVAPPVADVSRTVVHLAGELDDARLAAEFAALDDRAAGQLPDGATERYADVRFRGQSYELKVPVPVVSLASLSESFLAAYGQTYGPLPQGRSAEVVTLRVRRVGRGAQVRLPTVEPRPDGAAGGVAGGRRRGHGVGHAVQPRRAAGGGADGGTDAAGRPDGDGVRAGRVGGDGERERDGRGRAGPLMPAARLAGEPAGRVCHVGWLVVMAAVCAAAGPPIRLPTDGYVRPGRYFPVEVQAPVSLRADGCLPCDVAGTGRRRCRCWRCGSPGELSGGGRRSRCGCRRTASGWSARPATCRRGCSPASG